MLENDGAAATQRLFFALWPSAELSAGLADIAAAAARRFGGQVSRRESLHLTLAFLGDVPGEAIPALLAAGRQVVAAPFHLQIDRLGFWRHNRLLWAGCAPVPGLQALAGELVAALAAAGQPLPERQRTFAPHLTLARKLPAATSIAEVGDFPCTSLPEWSCSRFVLVASRPSAAGSIYSPLAEFPLSA
ncbi:MAG: RNA 2',3'-cyclic phosphodiesterase [Azonexus sp.]|uniref:RNA 2',3'-cyclic phosphodiesterase n=1 Tax=Azonexus sp. TaxID=1872668 RepID=UPI00281DDAA1|nr:RNA 2',3'-cyclic phosphodiesterase [Azonexus sp.]MDR0776999.1 RNA 2',3'-cyclic phosphodiesterase [Azonexus sp.]